MTAFFASLSIVAGLLMIASKSRARFPCFVGGCAAILAGGFILALPFLDSVQAVGWIWFCLWIASLPVLVACVVSLIVLTLKDRKLLAATVLGGIAILSNIAPTLWFLDAAASSAVDVHDKTKVSNETLIVRSGSPRIEILATNQT